MVRKLNVPDWCNCCSCHCHCQTTTTQLCWLAVCAVWCRQCSHCSYCCPIGGTTERASYSSNCSAVLQLPVPWESSSMPSEIQCQRSDSCVDGKTTLKLVQKKWGGRWASVNWSNMTQDRDMWWVCVNTVMIMQVAHNVDSFIISVNSYRVG